MNSREIPNVSRETMDDLNTFVDTLVKWNAKINLVSPGSIKNLWQRHIADSAQIYEVVEVKSGLWVDLGTGGGFPGLICAIMAKTEKPNLKFIFLESDTRKTLFLRTVIRELSLNARVENSRIEQTRPLEADVLTARALASLAKLLEFTDIHLKKKGLAIFPKGANFQQEIQDTLASWRFRVKKNPSKTDSEAVILQISEVERV